MLEGPALLAVTVVLILVLILLVAKVRLHAFLALILVAILLGLFTGMEPVSVVEGVTAGFGGTLESIGIVIALGVIIGEMLNATGGARVIANSILKAVGRERSPLAMGLSGGVVSIPVFCDSGFVLLTPIWRAISRFGQVPIIALSASLMAGLLATHCLVPPTPGPIAAAGMLGADLGRVVIFGLILSVPILLVSVLWAVKYLPKKVPRYVTDEEEGQEAKEEGQDVKPPATLHAYLPIIIPILLIVGNSFGSEYLAEGSSAFQLLGFVGNPAIALLIGTAIAFTMTPFTQTVRDTWIGRGLEKGTIIIMITGAAGGLGNILGSIGVGEYMGENIVEFGLPGVLLIWLISAFLITAQGSSTVALLTTPAIIGPMLSDLGVSPELAVLAVGAGAFFVILPNSSYFWVVAKFSGLDIKEGGWAITSTTAVMGLTGLAGVLVLSLFI